MSDKITVARLDAGGVFLEAEEVDADTTLGESHVADLPPDLGAPKGAWVRRGEAWCRRAALLDERDVYLRMVELAPEDPVTERHVLPVTECDLPANEYRWLRDKNGALTGPFDPLPVGQRAKPGRPTFEQALGFRLLADWERDPSGQHEITLAWLDDLVMSHDFKSLLRRPEVIAYAVARKLDLGKED